MLNVKNSIAEIDLKRLVPWLVAIAFFMESLDTTILNTAVPMISMALKVTPLSMKSVLSCYTLSLAVFIPISSWVADRFGTRRVFSTAIALFTLGSILCGISTNLNALVLYRILQGCGGAMMVPVGRLILVKTFAKSELIQAMSFVAIPSLIGPLLGPLAGGLLVGYFHWRMIFFVNIPIGLFGLYLVHRYLPDYREKKTRKLDVVGFILFGSGIALLSYVLEVFGEHALGNVEILSLLILVVVLLLGYFIHAIGIDYPVLSLNLLKIRTIRIAVTGSFITRLGVGGLPFLLPLFYQIGLGFSPIQSGLFIMPQSIAAMSLKMIAPRILTQFGYRKILLYNTMITGFLMIVFSVIGPGTSIALILLQSSAFGFFSSLQYTAMNTLVYADVKDQDASQTATLVSTVQQISMSFGVAVASLTASYFIPDRFHASTTEMLHGIHHAFIFLGVFTIVSAIGFQELKEVDGAALSKHY